jgi:hypothetical protein
MPRHRRSEVLPQRLLDAIKASPEHSFLGRVHFIRGGGLQGARVGLLKPKNIKTASGKAVDVQYTLSEHVITRVEFLREEIAKPLHIAHFNPENGIKLGTALDLY